MVKRKGTVKTTSNLQSLVFVAAGYMAPQEFTAHTELDDGVTVDIDAIIQSERVIARRVTVAAEGGVSSTAMRRVPIRDIAANACLDVLQRVEVVAGVAKLVPIREPHIDEVRQIVQRLVGYVEVSS